MTKYPTRQLIITSDDCGLSEGINNTALSLHHAGIVTTATLMMNFPATDHAIDMVRSTPTLRAGVHLNLTDGYPLTNIDPAAGLTIGDGRFQPRPLLFTRAVFPTPAWLDAAEAEMIAQIESFIVHTGKKPDHLTTHMHFHILPSLRDVVIQLARHYRIQWVRAFKTSSTIIPYNFLVQEPDELFHPDNLRITPDYLTTVQAWMLQEPARLMETLMKLNGLIEIVVHPDTADDITYPENMNHRPEAREKERDYILRFADLLHNNASSFDIYDPAVRH